MPDSKPKFFYIHFGFVARKHIPLFKEITQLLIYVDLHHCYGQRSYKILTNSWKSSICERNLTDFIFTLSKVCQSMQVTYRH